MICDVFELYLVYMGIKFAGSEKFFGGVSDLWLNLDMRGSDTDLGTLASCDAQTDQSIRAVAEKHSKMPQSEGMLIHITVCVLAAGACTTPDCFKR